MTRTLPALLGAALLGLIGAAPKPGTAVLPFLHDDYPRALAEAKARKVPIFIATSAHW